MDVNTRDKGVFTFGPFRLDPVRRLLLRDAAPVKLSARLFDTLLYLVQNHDRLIEHTELEQALWRGRMVEGGNVAKAVSSLRKALQADDAAASYIATVAGRGYRFAAPVAFVAEPSGGPARFSSANVAQAGGGQPASRQQASFPRRGAPWWRQGVAMRAGTVGFALFITGAVIWRILPPPGKSPSTVQLTALPRSVAVMRFRDVSDCQCLGALAAAITDDLAIGVAGKPGTLMVNQASPGEARDSRLPAPRVGEALPFRFTLEGTVRAVGTQVAINAQLIEATTGRHVWAEHFILPKEHLDAAMNAVRINIKQAADALEQNRQR